MYVCWWLSRFLSSAWLRGVPWYSSDLARGISYAPMTPVWVRAPQNQYQGERCKGTVPLHEHILGMQELRMDAGTYGPDGETYLLTVNLYFWIYTGTAVRLMIRNRSPFQVLPKEGNANLGSVFTGKVTAVQPSTARREWSQCQVRCRIT